MGRHRASVISDSSPSSSAESKFRELDDAFLQSQTRIWLGEVLNIRLDEDIHISDLLADGELLFDISKLVWNMLLTKCTELWHLKANLKGPVLSRKSSGRYMPYSNVDSFLKICKILGLNDIDLLSPSDVVEKRNTRKVCICLRALSKKARSKQLHVPDFDIVTNTISMSTNKVGCIKRSLESSHSGLSSSSSNSLHIHSSFKLSQNQMKPFLDGNDDSLSGESDEAESKYMGANSNLENSPEEYSSTKMKRYDIENGQYKSRDNFKSVKCNDRDYISEYLAFSDSVVFGIDGYSPVIPDGEDNSYNFFMGIDENQIKDSDIEDEVSSTTSMSSVLGRVLNMEFDDRFDLDDSSSLKDGSLIICEKTQGMNEFEGHLFENKGESHDIAESKDTNTDLGKDRNGGPGQKLLRTVAKGTAIIGVLFFLLQVRNRGGDKDGKVSKKKSGENQMKSFSFGESQSRKGSKGKGVYGIYPTEKLKVGK